VTAISSRGVIPTPNITGMVGAYSHRLFLIDTFSSTNENISETGFEKYRKTEITM
jgi:hypothetical protein